MKKEMVFRWSLLALGIYMAAIIGCVPPTGIGDEFGDGSLVLSFSDSRARTLIPTISLDIAAYDISFTRTGQPTVTLNDVPGTSTQAGPVYLKPGPWTVSANAKNATGDIIGVGMTSVAVNAGHTATATLTIQSLIGDGTMALTASTSELSLISPSVVGMLTPGSGAAPISLSFTMGSGTASYSGAVAAGTYLLQLELWDGTEKLASYVDTALVAANFSTSAAFAFKPKNGSVIVQLVDEITRAIPITLSGAQATLAVGSTMTVIATPAVAVDNYQWYLDGVAIIGATTNEVTVGAGLEEGEYTLTVVVKKGAVYSSESVGFVEVVDSGEDAIPPQILGAAAGQYDPFLKSQSVTISGTASDDRELSLVYFALDGGSPVDAAGTETWSADLSLGLGNHTVAVYARDASGNTSAGTEIQLNVFDPMNDTDYMNIAAIVPNPSPALISLAVRDSIVYAVDYNNDAVYVFEIDAGGSPHLLSTLTGVVDDNANLAIIGDYLCIAGFAGYFVYDIGNPANPVFVTRPSLEPLTRPRMRFETSLNRLYICENSGPSEIKVYDLSDPAVPIEIGSIDLSALGLVSTDPLISCSSISFLSEKIMCQTVVSSTNLRTFYVIDISTIDSPEIAYSEQTSIVPQFIYVKGMLLAQADDSLKVYNSDLPDPAYLSSTYSIAFSYSGFRLFPTFTGDYLFCGNRVLDVSDINDILIARTRNLGNAVSFLKFLVVFGAGTS